MFLVRMKHTFNRSAPLPYLLSEITLTLKTVSDLLGTLTRTYFMKRLEQTTKIDGGPQFDYANEIKIT